jgi:phage major head subunit gpT-like protein
MMPINSGSFSKALQVGINAWYGDTYAEFPVEYTDLVDTFTSRKAFEEDVGYSGFGLAQIKPEGQGVAFDSAMQGFTTRYTHLVYALGFIITREMVDDDQYDIVAETRARGLALSMRQTKETVVSNIYNRAFNSSYTGGDGKEMIATDHPNVAGGTWANELATAANLSEAALEQSCIDIAKWTNDRGLRINYQPLSLHLPVELGFEATRILKAEGRVGTADNDPNAIKVMGKFPKGIKVNHYFTSTTAWFLRTACPNGLKLFERDMDEFGEDNDWDTENAKFKARGRYAVGWTDPKGIYGTPGV